MEQNPNLMGRSFVHPAALMRINNLEMRAKVVVEGFWNGLHRSPFHGFSVEFTEYRPYSQGDDPRYIDWKLYARSDRFHIKKFEDETNLRCMLLVDASRSMGFGSLAYSKGEYANTLAATLAYFLFKQGDAVGLLTFDEEIREYVPARQRPGHIRLLNLALEKNQAGSATDLATPLRRIAEITRRRGLICLISDLLAPVDTLEKDLAQLVACGHELIVFQLADPAEVHFQYEDPILFRDVESGRELFIDPVTARQGYLKRLASHHAAVAGLCRRNSVHHHSLTTDQPLELALFDFLRARSERRLRVRRGRGPGGNA